MSKEKKNKICMWFGHKLRLKHSRIIWCDRCNRKVDNAKYGYMGESLLDFDKKHQYKLIYLVIGGLYLMGVLGYLIYQNFILDKSIDLMVGVMLFMPMFLLMNISSVSKPKFLN